MHLCRAERGRAVSGLGVPAAEIDMLRAQRPGLWRITGDYGVQNVYMVRVYDFHTFVGGFQVEHRREVDAADLRKEGIL